jgi:hypothetical protein
MAYNELFSKKEFEDFRLAEIASGKNRFGALTIMDCPKCGVRNECGLAMHLCVCEHFVCSGCGHKWESAGKP